jgi:hypothetical protein
LPTIASSVRPVSSTSPASHGPTVRATLNCTELALTAVRVFEPAASTSRECHEDTPSASTAPEKAETRQYGHSSVTSAATRRLSTRAVHACRDTATSRTLVRRTWSASHPPSGVVTSVGAMVQKASSPSADAEPVVRASQNDSAVVCTTPPTLLTSAAPVSSGSAAMRRVTSRGCPSRR